MILYNFWQLVKDETKVKVSFYEGYELKECSLDFIVNNKKYLLNEQIRSIEVKDGFILIFLTTVDE